MRRVAILLCALAIGAVHGGETVPTAVAASIAEAADRGDDFASLLPALDDAGRIEALIQIGGRRIAAATRAAAGCLDSANAEVRLAALRAVGALPVEPEAQAKARGALHDVDPRVRRAAIACAVALDDRFAVGDIADSLADATNGNDAHDALVRLAGGNDLGHQPEDWKRWQDERRAKVDAAIAGLREQLESSDKSVVLAALPNVALLDLTADQKERLVEPLRHDSDPAIAAAAGSVWCTVTGTTPDPVGSADNAASSAAAPSADAAPLAKVVSRPFARGDIVVFAACAAATGVGAALFVFLVRSGRSITKHFTRVISVQLRKKGGPKSEPSAALQAATAQHQSAGTGRSVSSARTPAVDASSPRTASSSRTAAVKATAERSGAAKVVSDRVAAAKPASDRTAAVRVISDRVPAAVDHAKPTSERIAAVRAVSERIAAVKADAKAVSDRVPAANHSPAKP